MTAYTDRQNQIIQESIQLIAQKGIQGLTIKNISRAIGVSEPAIYRHFDSKDDIILGIIFVLKNTVGPEPGPESGAEPGEGNTLDRIKARFQGQTKRFIKNPSLTAIVFSEGIFNSSSILAIPIRTMMETSQQKLIGTIVKGQASGEIRNDINATQVSLMMIGSFRFLVRKWHLTDYGFDLKAEVDELLNSLEKVLTG